MNKNNKNSLLRNRGAISLETIIGVSILLVLVFTAFAIFMKQFVYDEERFDQSLSQSGEEQVVIKKETSINLVNFVPENYDRMSASEDFDETTLSDKINGKAELYLESGFEKLTAQRFADKANAEIWFELYLYDMGNSRNAFTVYGSQKREDAKLLDISPYSYSSENSLFFIHGKYYVEIIAAKVSDEINSKMIEMASNFIYEVEGEDFILVELKYLAVDGLDKGSAKIYQNNGFGFEKFNDLVTANYYIEGKGITAFISLRATKEEAAALVEEYNKYLVGIAGGTKEESPKSPIANLKTAKLMDEYEMVFSYDNIVAGIHTAADKQAGENAALTIYNKIKEVKDGSK